MKLAAATAVALALLVPSLWAQSPVRAPAVRSSDDQLVVEITEDLLNRLVTHRHTTLRPVQDVILEAQVFGQEQTSTELRIDLTPSRDGAAAEFRLTGQTASDTMGYTPQAAVHTLGDNSFSAAKLVVFDGTMFRTQRPRVQVVPYSQTVCAATPADGTPLGPLFAGFAYQIAQARRSEADIVVADRISRRVGAEFNSDVDRQLATLNQGWLRQVRPWLVQAGWLPAATRASSTGDRLHYAVRFQNGLSLPPVPSPSSAGREPARVNRIAVHESVLNFALASLKLDGLQFAPDQLDEFLRPAHKFLSGLSDEPPRTRATPRASSTPADAAVVQLDRQQPVRVELRDGEVHITFRASFALPLGGATPLQTIRIRSRIEPEEYAFLLAPAEVTVQAVDESAGQPEMVSALIQSQVESRVPTIRIPRRIAVPSASSGKVLLSIREPVLEDGWLVLEIE
jgi:hypothetical protein